MSPDKLVTTLKQELVRNKKKSAILGVMCLVALYFWAPLAWSWIAPGGDESDSSTIHEESIVGVGQSAPTPEATVGSFAPASAAGTGRTTRRRELPWQELLQMIENDERMASAVLADSSRDPFAAAGTAGDLTLDVASSPQEVAAQQDADVAQLTQGLELTGIVYGPRLRLATINGKTYREHDTLEFGALPASGVAAELADMEDEIAAIRETAEEQGATGATVDVTMEETGEAISDLPAAAVPSLALLSGRVAAIVEEIRPKTVALRFSNGTVVELKLGGARLGGHDVIHVTRASPSALSKP